MIMSFMVLSTLSFISTISLWQGSLQQQQQQVSTQQRIFLSRTCRILHVSASINLERLISSNAMEDMIRLIDCSYVRSMSGLISGNLGKDITPAPCQDILHYIKQRAFRFNFLTHRLNLHHIMNYEEQRRYSICHSRISRMLI